MKTRNKVFAHKVDATKGTDPIPTVADDLIILNGDINMTIPTEQDSGAEDLKGTMGSGDAVTTKQSMSLPVATRVRGLGQGAAALLVPHIHAALMGSGHAVVSSGDGSATPRKSIYTPTSDPALIKTATGYFWEDGLLYKQISAANDLSFEASMSALKASYNVQAAYEAATVVALPSVSLQTEEVFRMTSALCVIDEAGTEVNIGAFTFNTGTDVQEAYETGQHYFEVANREPVITIDPRAVANTTDWDRLTNASSIIIIATFTNSIGETLEFKALRAVPSEVSTSGRAGNITRGKTFSLKETNGDDQYSVTWTSVL